MICSNAVHSQLSIEPLHYRTRIANDSLYFKDHTQVHSSVLPLITNKFERHLDAGDPLVWEKSKNSHFRLYPLARLNGGIHLGSANNQPIYQAGAGLGLDFSSSKWFITGKFLPFLSAASGIADSLQTHHNYYPGASQGLNQHSYHFSELLVGFKPNRFFTFLGGYGRNFFGEGYRSLLLSDNATANPFFKIETQFGNIKYVNLFQGWSDNVTNPFDRSLNQRKFAAMHYISWNVTREFNISIFETVVWQANDTLVNRGFDPSYLNPIVFYRPVEYGNGSADNVLLGANFSFKVDEANVIYTQFILDDFLLKEIRARSRWWANKYGYQLGYKSADFLGIEDFYFQSEFNVVRPFTFSHRTTGPAYGHLNASVTHPIGANFWEVVNIVSKPFGRFRLTNKITYAGYGVDTSSVSYGQNIFRPYTNREGEYDHFIMQGEKRNVLTNSLTLEMPLIASVELFAFFNYQFRSETIKSTTRFDHQFRVGISSRLWNRYTDF